MESSLWTFPVRWWERRRFTVEGCFCSHLSYFSENRFTSSSDIKGLHSFTAALAFKWFKVFIHVKSSKWWCRLKVDGDVHLTIGMEWKRSGIFTHCEESLHMLIGWCLLEGAQWKDSAYQQDILARGAFFFFWKVIIHRYGIYWEPFIIFFGA